MVSLLRGIRGQHRGRYNHDGMGWRGGLKMTASMNDLECGLTSPA